VWPNAFHLQASAIGKNMTNAKTFLEKRYSDEMALEDAVHTSLLTLKEGFEGQVSGSNIEVRGAGQQGGGLWVTCSPPDGFVVSVKEGYVVARTQQCIPCWVLALFSVQHSAPLSCAPSIPTGLAVCSCQCIAAAHLLLHLRRNRNNQNDLCHECFCSQ
jgi:hypothetical protein